MRTSFALAVILGLANIANAQSPGVQVDSLMSAFARTGAPGGVITVVDGTETVFQKGYGMASLEQGIAIRAETIFDIGSVSKQFTGFAIAMLAEEGALSLDDDVRNYLPAVPDFGHPITIRNLLNHTSGLREIYEAKGLAGFIGGDAIEQREALRVTTHMKELNFEPGTEYLYCNTAYMLAADIVSQVTGVPFPDWMKQNVFIPLGMENAEIMDSLGEVIVGAADSYTPLQDGGFRRRFDNSSAYGQGGIYASSSDLARWLVNMGTMQLGGPSVFEQFTTRGVLADGDTLVYAMGISIREHRGQTVWVHTGASAGFRSALAWFPELSAGVFVQGNRSDFGSVNLVWQVTDAFFGDRLGPIPETPEIPARPDRPEPEVTLVPSDYVGRYLSDELEAVYSVTAEDGRVIVSHRRLGDWTLESRARDVFNIPGLGRAHFERDDRGNVTGFRISSGRLRNLLFERLD